MLRREAAPFSERKLACSRFCQSNTASPVPSEMRSTSLAVTVISAYTFKSSAPFLKVSRLPARAIKRLSPGEKPVPAISKASSNTARPSPHFGQTNHDRESFTSPKIVINFLGRMPTLCIRVPHKHKTPSACRPVPIPESISSKSRAPAANTTARRPVSHASKSTPFSVAIRPRNRFTSASDSTAISAFFLDQPLSPSSLLSLPTPTKPNR